MYSFKQHLITQLTTTMKQTILSFIMLLLPIAAACDEIVEIDGIYYSHGIYINDNTYMAVVVSNPNKYSGNIIIPESVTINGNTYVVKSIDPNAFAGCEDLTSVAVPNNVAGVCNFENCISLSSVYFPSLTEIPSCAFDGCSSLISITANNITSIGYNAFRGCSSLISINTNHVTSIGSGAFNGCSSLT